MIKLLATTCSRHYNILAKTKKNKIYDTLQHCKNRPVMVTVLKGYNQLQKVIFT